MKQNQEKSSLKFLAGRIAERQTGIDCIGLSDPAKASVVYELYSEMRAPMVITLPTSKEAELFVEDLKFFASPSTDSILYYSPYNILPFKFMSDTDAAADRMHVLYRLVASDQPFILVTTVDALLQKVLPKKGLCDFAEPIEAGEESDLESLTEKLLSGGYVRSIIVEEPGEFSVRGGILDVFCPLYPEPLRTEFFGDTVESLRFFSSENQRTTQSVSEAILIPAREAVLEPGHRDEIINRIRVRAADLEMPVRALRKLIDQIKNEGSFPRIEGLTAMVYPELDSLFDYLPESTLFMLSEPNDLSDAAAHFKKQVDNNYQSALEEHRFCVRPDEIYLDWPQTRATLFEKKPIVFKLLPVLPDGGAGDAVPLQVHFSVSDNTDIRDQLKHRREKEHLLLPLADWIRDKLAARWSILLVCRTRAQIERLRHLLEPYDISFHLVDRFSEITTGAGAVYASQGQLSAGFVWPDQALAIITDHDIFSARQRRRVPKRKQIRTDLLSLDELQQEDLVVHIDHGIGQYLGLVKLKLDGATNDYLHLIYKGGDKLYLPIDRMNMIQKYLGVDGIAPVLARLGGKSWEKIKSRVKRTAEKIAGELLDLYAARKVKSGVSFGKPDEYFRDFEGSFPFEETDDQVKAIEDVLADMENPMPMDRLICGDVGYGKTEVALRASFMAVYNGKQAALLVPTTVLAEQHYKTFTDRFVNHPVSIACLSRFRTRSEQLEIIENLKSGKIDIVIGTHRLVQKDVSFKDLGLIIIDEEQRFGVKHKEKLKQFRKTVDVLALTATPIPRTLHMSLMGVRDISVISTPPEHRRPILTYISEFDDAIITGAIQKELERKGQIFFVHNNIYSIEGVATHLKRLIPEVRLDVAHGRMNEATLEKVMFRFIKREIDLLVCTTIIESGLDIPSANTILVNRADKFGLAQMYQLRGRVGRADEQAYAYLFVPRGQGLTKDAQKRLKVLMEHSDLGSGFQIAMSDLKIRGGGTILGASQSGHIAAVGYDMFLQLMEQAVSSLNGEPVSESLEPEINLPLSSFLPETYIPDIDQRLSSYRRLSRMTNVKEVSEFNGELLDRFGPLPDPAENLLQKIMLKILARKAAVQKFDLAGRVLVLTLSQPHLQNPQGVVDMVMADPKRFEILPDNVLKMNMISRNLRQLVNEAKNILKEISQHVNG
jgi:transcription-repair coupling factor (superfamily II helicase)